MFSSKISIWHKKLMLKNKIFLPSLKLFFIYKNILKVTYSNFSMLLYFLTQYFTLNLTLN